VVLAQAHKKRLTCSTVSQVTSMYNAGSFSLRTRNFTSNSTVSPLAAPQSSQSCHCSVNIFYSLSKSLLYPLTTIRMRNSSASSLQNCLLLIMKYRQRDSDVTWCSLPVFSALTQQLFPRPCKSSSYAKANKNQLTT
jgi:hypothetical protein